MKRLGFLLLMITMSYVILPGYSFGWKSYTYDYRADGTMEVKTSKNGAGDVLSILTLDSFGRAMQAITYQEGANNAVVVGETITYEYNGRTGASTQRKTAGSGDGRVDETTYVNIYGQELIVLNNVPANGEWQVFHDRGSNGNANVNQAAGADAALAMLNRLFSTDATNTAARGFNFLKYDGRLVKSVNTFDNNGNTATYSFSSSADRVGSRVIFVSEKKTVGANGRILNHIDELSDPGKEKNLHLDNENLPDNPNDDADVGFFNDNGQADQRGEKQGLPAPILPPGVSQPF